MVAAPLLGPDSSGLQLAWWFLAQYLDLSYLSLCRVRCDELAKVSSAWTGKKMDGPLALEKRL